VHSRVEELRALELIYEKAIHPELAYMFKHALTHDVAYHSVQQGQRIRLHRIIGITIEELYKDRLAEHYETLAHHFELGESWERAFRYHELAAGKAAEAYANHSVVHHTRSALRLGVRLGAAFDEERESALEERLGLALFYLSEYGESGRAYERGAARAAAVDRRATLLACASLSYFWAHEYERATRTYESAYELARRNGIEAVQSAALYLGGTYAGITAGDIETFSRMCGSALELERRSGSDFAAAIGCFVQAELYEWTADYRRAVEVAERGIGLGRKLRLSHLIVWPMWFGGKALCCLGEYALALERLREAFEICDRIGDRAWRSRLLNTLGWCYAEMGAVETAAEHNRRAAAIAHDFGDPEIIANSEINLALNKLALGDRTGAEEIIGPLRQEVDTPGDPWMRWRFSLHAMEANAQLALARADPETALRESQLALERAVRHHAVKLEARAALTSGRALLDLERRDEARDTTRRAVDLARRIAHPGVEQRALRQLALIADRCGDLDEARMATGQADAVRERMAAKTPDGELRASLLRSTE
jgi:tetratricopeptide (TPR) repeat protein